MKLASIIPAECIVDELRSTGSESALEEMTRALVRTGKVKKRAAPDIVKALMEREERGSTGIGKGVAVPHAKHESVSGLVGAFGRSSRGVEFAALDGQPVRLVFLLLASKDSSGPYLKALARVARLVKDGRFCRFLIEAKGGPEELAALLAEADAQLDDADNANGSGR